MRLESRRGELRDNLASTWAHRRPDEELDENSSSPWAIERARARKLEWVAFAAFFLSGSSSLIFQAIWSRLLCHVFGATAVAISTVVSCFMIGLGLGAWLAGKFADRIRVPVVAYAWAELGVALWAVWVPMLVSSDGWLVDVNRWLRTEIGAESFGFMFARFFCVLPILLVPTTLMGASLPLLARQFTATRGASESVSKKVGALYSMNTLGAVVGVFLGGFVLMPLIGVHRTNLVAVAINAFLGLGILAFHRRAADKTIPSPQEAEPENGSVVSETPPEISPFAKKAAFVAFAASGASALCYEVTWTRALAITIGSSIYSFTIILGSFLMGIATGSAIASGLLGARPKVIRTALACALPSALIASILWFVERGPKAGAIAVGASTAAVIALAWCGHQYKRIFALLALMVPPLAGGVCLWLLKATPKVTGTYHLGMVATVVAGCVCGLPALLFAMRRNPILQLASVQLFVAACAFANYVFQDELPYVFARLITRIGKLHEHVATGQFSMFLTAALCVIPATLGMGAMFPLTLRVWARGGASVGRDVGRLYAGNTIGSILGAWLPGFVLMPWIGIEHTLVVGIWLNLALALLMLVASGTPQSTSEVEPKIADTVEDFRRPSGMGSVWQAAAVYVLTPVVPALAALLYLCAWRGSGALRWDLGTMTLGVFRVSLADDALEPEAWGSPDVVYYRDGLATTVSIERWSSGHTALKNNGKVDASNGDDMGTQIMVAGFPLLLHPKTVDNADVAVIGFGSGVTLGAALQFPGTHIDAIELERSIPEASRWFKKVNHLNYPLKKFPYVEMPRLHVINDDGRNYLASTTRKYDVIISEPSNPWITGVSDLFTVDHFRISKRRLKEGGLYCQWVQLYELSPERIKTIYRTFASEFRYVTVFSAGVQSSDTILLGSDAPIRVDAKQLAARFAHKGIATEMQRAQMGTPMNVLASVLLGNKSEVLQYAQIEYHKRSAKQWEAKPELANDPNIACIKDCRREPAILNTDDNANIEFAAPKDLIAAERTSGYLWKHVYTKTWPYGRVARFIDQKRVVGIGVGDTAARTYAELALALIGHGRRAEAPEFIERSEKAGHVHETRVAIEVLSLFISDEKQPAIRIEEPSFDESFEPKEVTALRTGLRKVREALNEDDYQAALNTFEDIPEVARAKVGSSLQFLYGYLLYKVAEVEPSQYATVIEKLGELVETDIRYVNEHPEVFYYLARARDAEFEYIAAEANMRRYVERVLAIADAEARENKS